MRSILAIALLLCSFAFGQDGFYGSVTVGQKTLKLECLNDSLKPYGVSFGDKEWTVGGAGYVIVANRFLIGGKGFGFSNEKKALDGRFMRISGGMGLATFGFLLLNDRDINVRLYPQVGAGFAPFSFQAKKSLGDVGFNNILKSGDDGLVLLNKVGAAIDGSISLDWYIKFIHFMWLFPGLEVGPLLHAECGYTYVPGNTRWLRDVDATTSFQPDFKFDGFYYHVGLGFGISSGKKNLDKN